MDTEILKFLLIKARKIEIYKSRPRTDEQYLNYRAVLINAYKKAKKNYRETSDKKFLKEMERIKVSLSYCVSRTEYDCCKKIIKEYKERYGSVIQKNLWDYYSLSQIFYKILSGKAKNLETAVKMYSEEVKELKRVEKFIKLKYRRVRKFGYN